MLLKTIFLPFLLVATFSLFAQELLVNGGFEEENICTEYKVDCAPEAWISNTNGFNNYFKDANRAFAGLHSLAIEAGHSTKPFFRTFVRSRLLCGLRKDHEYLLEFYVKSPHAILDSIGVVFTPYDFLFEKRRLHTITPAFYLKPSSGKFASDSSWQKVSMIYTAKGDESFITIANFSKRDVTGNTNIELVKNFYVFLDEISMRSLDPNETTCPDYSATKQDIYDQDERHHFLQQLIKIYSRDPPVIKSTPTQFVNVDTITLADVLFSVGKATLDKDHQPLIDSFCDKLKASIIDSIIVEGHTDNTGTLQANEKLSYERAVTVSEEIKKRMPSSGIILISRGYADTRPLTANETPEGKQRNRRVEVLVYTRE